MADHEYIEDVIALAGRRADELKMRLDKGCTMNLQDTPLYKDLNLAHNKLLLALEVLNLEI